MSSHVFSSPLVAGFALLALMPDTASAQPNPFDAQQAIHLHLPPAPARSEARARRAIAMLDRAALVACGGSDDSFAQVKAALRGAACWNGAMAGAVEQAGDPKLSAWWASHRP